MYRLRPLINRLTSRRNSSHEPFLSSADDRVVVGDSSIRHRNPAVIAQTEIDLITCMRDNVPRDPVMETLLEGEIQSGQTTCYIFRDALVHDGSIFTKRGHYHIRPRQGRLLPLTSIEKKTNGLLCTNWVIEKYFGHWLHDGLMLELLSHELGHEPISFNRKPWIHEPEYRKLAECAVFPIGTTIFDELVIPDDIALNDCWKDRMDLLRTRMIGPSPVLPNRSVYMMRGQSAVGRTLVNENTIAEFLSARGFEILHPEKSSVSEIKRLLSAAQLIVAMEGSAQAHALMFAQTGIKFLSIQPADQFNVIFKPLFDAVGQTWGACIADGENGNYVMDLDRLAAAIELVMSSEFKS